MASQDSDPAGSGCHDHSSPRRSAPPADPRDLATDEERALLCRTLRALDACVEPSDDLRALNRANALLDLCEGCGDGLGESLDRAAVEWSTALVTHGVGMLLAEVRNSVDLVNRLEEAGLGARDAVAAALVVLAPSSSPGQDRTRV